jgi:hypothetical protein
MVEVRAQWLIRKQGLTASGRQLFDITGRV